MEFIAFSAPLHPGVNQWATSINNQAQAGKVPPCALAAIVANETGGRNVLQEGMPPGPGCGVGLCQITSGVDWTNLAEPTYQAEGKSWALLDPSSNLYVAAKFYLAPVLADLLADRAKRQNAYARFSGEILYFVFAAYNVGIGEVLESLSNGHDPDSYTTDHYAERALRWYHQFLMESQNNAKA